MQRAAPRAPARLAYIDVARGLAVVCMVQHHAFDAWLPSSFHGSALDGWLRFFGGVAAPSFLLLAGLSIALGLEGRAHKGLPRRQAASWALRRAAFILAAAYLLRVEQWWEWSFVAPLSTILRLDVLHCIAASVALLAGLWALRAGPLVLTVAACAVALATPAVWTGGALLDALPAHLADWLRGRPPQAIFPLFPWASFTLLGGAAGLLLHRARRSADPGAEGRLVALLGGGALAAWALVTVIERFVPWQGAWDAAPAHVLVRCGVPGLLLWVGHAAERARAGRSQGAWALPAFAAGLFALLGRHSLVIYWVHLDLVYGPLRRDWLGALPFEVAAPRALALLAGMVLLAALVEGLQGLWKARGRLLGAPRPALEP